MENANIDQHSSSYNQKTTEPKKCWICFATDDDDDHDDNGNEINKDWVSPCKCIGSTQWVHQCCIQRWIDIKRNKNMYFKVHCSQCRIEYIIVYDEVNILVQLLNKLDDIDYGLSIVMIVVGGLGGFYWSLISYGTITIIQMMGEEEAIIMLDNINAFTLILMLPLIPVGLITTHMIDWEKILLLCVQKLTSQLPLLRTMMPSFLSEPDNSSMSRLQDNLVLYLTTTKFCTAIILPTAATIVGRLLFKNILNSCIQKTLLGGLVCITVKGVLTIYKRHHNIIHQKTRQIINYLEPNTEENN